MKFARYVPTSCFLAGWFVGISAALPCLLRVQDPVRYLGGLAIVSLVGYGGCVILGLFERKER